MGLQLSQQINLYQSEFIVQSDLLCAKNVQNLLIIIVVLLTVISAFDYIQQQSQVDYLMELKAKHSKLAVLLQQAKQSAPSMVLDSHLQRQVNSHKLDIVNKQQVLDTLSGQTFGNTSGFSEYFKGLARQSVTGMWLTNFNIRSGGKNIGISGSAFRPELIPDFLTSLSNEKIFQGTTFQTFRVTRQENPIRVDFFVDTQFLVQISDE